MPTPAELETLEARVRAVEGRTGTQVVVALVDRADLYHGLRWRAFAFGAALAGAALVLGGALRPGWIPHPASATVFTAVAGVLGTGLALALAASLAPPFARLFLEPLRAEAEARQRAESIFLERELFGTRERTAVLLLACRFERQAVVLADTGFRGRIADDDWLRVGAAMGARVRAGREVEGLLAGLDALECTLVAKDFTGAVFAGNEIPDRPLSAGGS